MPDLPPPCPDSWLFKDFFSHLARSITDRPLVNACDEAGKAHSMSYGELYAVATYVEICLSGRGFGGYQMQPGDRIALYGSNSPVYLACILGIWRAGAVACPIPLDSTSEQLMAMMAILKPKMLLSSRESPLVPETEEAPTRYSFSQFLSGEDDCDPDILGLKSMLSRSQDNKKDSQEVPRTLGVEKEQRTTDACAYLFTSSGVSAASLKCVPITHRALVQGCYHIAVMNEVISTPQRVIGWAPFSHSLGLATTFVGACLHTGGCYSFAQAMSSKQPSSLPTAIVDRARQFSGTYVDAAPIFLNEWSRMDAFPSKLAIYIGGAPPTMDNWQWARKNGINLYQAPGLTETGALLRGPSASSPQAHSYDLFLAVRARADISVTIDVQDEEEGQQGVGELVIASKNIITHYLRLGDDQNQAVDYNDSNGETTFRTGDLYKQSVDQSLQYMCRKDDQVHLSSGEKVSAIEWEARLNAQDGIKQACITGFPMPRDTDGFVSRPAEHIIALVEVQDDCKPRRMQVAREAVAKINERYSRVARIAPKYVYVLSEGEKLPTTRKETLHRKRVSVEASSTRAVSD